MVKKKVNTVTRNSLVVKKIVCKYFLFGFLEVKKEKSLLDV